MLQSLTNLGITDDQTPEQKKRMRILNQMNLLTILIGSTLSVIAVLFELGTFAIFFSVIMTVFCFVPIILSAKGHSVLSRVWYLTQSYLIIFFLPILFGPEMHYQYFLVAGIGMPLIFLHNEIGKWKWVLVFVAVPFFVFLEWYTRNYEALIYIDPETSDLLGFFNDLFMMSTVMIMFYVFTSNNQKQLEEIEEQKRLLREFNINLNRSEGELKRSLDEALKYQLQLLAVQLNPNFIHTSMNSLQHSIMNNETEKALNYTADFSKLVRSVYDNSTKLYIALDKELEFIKQFLKLEQKRVDFDFLIELDEGIEPSILQIPPMIIQPYIENAIVHGFAGGGEGNLLKLRFIKEKGMTKCIIEDNGVGVSESIDTAHTRSDNVLRKNRGIALNRLDLYGQIEKKEFRVETLDLNEEDSSLTGTRVIISIPAFLQADISSKQQN